MAEVTAEGTKSISVSFVPLKMLADDASDLGLFLMKTQDCLHGQRDVTVSDTLSSGGPVQQVLAWPCTPPNIFTYADTDDGEIVRRYC